MSEIGEISGVKIMLSKEQFEDYKGTLNEQLESANKEIERLHSIIKEVREYPDNAKDNYIINKHQYVNFDNIREILDKEHKQIYGDKLQVEWFEESILDKES